MTIQTTVYTVTELLDNLKAQCAVLWPAFSGYVDALPEPSKNRAVNRDAFFLVYADSGSMSHKESEGQKVDVKIGLQCTSDASVSGDDYSNAIRTLRNCIDVFARWAFQAPDAVHWGARFSGLAWEVPIAAPRPVWQAQINFSIELPRQIADNFGGFLV